MKKRTGGRLKPPSTYRLLPLVPVPPFHGRLDPGVSPNRTAADFGARMRGKITPSLTLLTCNAIAMDLCHLLGTQ